MKKRGNSYFIYLQRLAERMFFAARYMNEVCRTHHFDSREIETNMHAAVHIRGEMLEELSHEFLPPIEREDIASLAFALTRVMMRCGEVTRFFADCRGAVQEEMQKGALSGYLYVKTLFDAVKCLDDAGSPGLAECLAQAQSLSSQCSGQVNEMREYAFSLSGDAKKLLASVTFCDRCGSVYEQCDLTSEMIRIITLKNG